MGLDLDVGFQIPWLWLGYFVNVSTRAFTVTVTQQILAKPLSFWPMFCCGNGTPIKRVIHFKQVVKHLQPNNVIDSSTVEMSERVNVWRIIYKDKPALNISLKKLTNVNVIVIISQMSKTDVFISSIHNFENWRFRTMISYFLFSLLFTFKDSGWCSMLWIVNSFMC